MEIKEIRKYADYVEKHINNINKAWANVQTKCKSFRFISDDYVFFTIDGLIKTHDASKLSAEEFIPYADWFYGDYGKNWDSFDTVHEEEHNRIKLAFDNAWKHHLENNMHHWQSWGSKEFYNPYEAEIHCVCMLCDWIAMSYEFGDTASDYYSKNKHKIILPEWADSFIISVLNTVESI